MRSFQRGQPGRIELRQFIEAFPSERWDVEQDFTLVNSLLKATPRKVVIHILIHEIRHWAQIATLLRFHGVSDAFHDFLFSPVLGGEFRRAQDKA